MNGMIQNLSQCTIKLLKKPNFRQVAIVSIQLIGLMYVVASHPCRKCQVQEEVPADFSRSPSVVNHFIHFTYIDYMLHWLNSSVTSAIHFKTQQIKSLKYG